MELCWDVVRCRDCVLCAGCVATVSHSRRHSLLAKCGCSLRVNTQQLCHIQHNSFMTLPFDPPPTFKTDIFQNGPNVENAGCGEKNGEDAGDILAAVEGRTNSQKGG